MPQSRIEDRNVGTMLGLTSGDALGAGYEFGPPLPDDFPVSMIGGGTFAWEPGEWTDDTGMAVAIALAMKEARARGVIDADEAMFDAIVSHWADWESVTKDIGTQTSRVFSLSDVGKGTATAARLRTAARDVYAAAPSRSAGNGSLMRTAPIALFLLDHEMTAVADLAIAISNLTHADPVAGEACALWSTAIWHAVHTGEIDIRVGLPLLNDDRADQWLGLIEVAEAKSPSHFTRNGWVVEAFQGAWSAISHTKDDGRPATDHLIAALEEAVRGGRDTDTVAAIAGGLLGAAYGASAIPRNWQAIIHGWPGIDAEGLAALSIAIAPAHD